MSVKKILSIIMALAIVLTMASFPAFAADAVRLTYDTYSCTHATVSWGKPLSNLFVRDDGICEFSGTMYTKNRGEDGTFNVYLDPTGDVAYSVSKIELKAAYSNHFTSFAIYGSNEAATAEAEWTLLADYTTTEGASNAIVTREFEHEGGYKYFRFEGYGVGKNGAEIESGKPQYKYILLYGTEYVESEGPSYDLTDAADVKGSNIRLETADLTAGLRFGASVSKAALAIEGDWAYDAEADYEFGMYLLPEDMLAEGETLTEYLANGEQDALKVVAKKFLSQTADAIEYTAVLTDIPKDDYDRKIVAVPYVTAGEETAYYEEQADSYASVAQKALDSYNGGNPNNLTQDQVKALKDILGIEEEPETYVLTFSAGEGTGEMAPMTGDTAYTLPECTFTAPEGKRFAGWNVFGYTQAPGTEVVLTSDRICEAVWEDIPEPVKLTFDSYTTDNEPVGWSKPLSNLFVRDDGICEFSKTMYTKPRGEGTFNLYLDPAGDVAYSVSKIELKAAYSTHFTSFAIYGSNEAATAEAEWTLLADYTTTEGASNAIVTREFEHEGGYKYFRFEGYGIGKNGAEVESGKPQYKYILLYGTECAE